MLTVLIVATLVFAGMVLAHGADPGLTVGALLTGRRPGEEWMRKKGSERRSVESPMDYLHLHHPNSQQGLRLRWAIRRGVPVEVIRNDYGNVVDLIPMDPAYERAAKKSNS